MTSVSKETVYELDKDGKRILPGRDISGVSVIRFEFGQRASSTSGGVAWVGGPVFALRG